MRVAQRPAWHPFGLTPASNDSPRFASDLAFLRQHTNVVVLGDRADGARIVVAPDYQGRVLTSTTGGANAPELRMDRPGGDRVGQDDSRT